MFYSGIYQVLTMVIFSLGKVRGETDYVNVKDRDSKRGRERGGEEGKVFVCKGGGERT